MLDYEKVQQYINLSDEAIVLCDIYSFEMVMANEKYAHWFDDKFVIGKSIFDIFLLQRRERILAGLEKRGMFQTKFLDKRRGFIDRHYNMTFKKCILEEEEYLCLTINDDNASKEIETLCNAVQDMRDHNDNLLSLKREVIERTQVKDILLSHTARKLRTPINGLLGMIHYLDETELSHAQREILSGLELCSLDIMNVLEELALLQEETTDLNFKEGKVNLSILFEEMKDIVQVYIRNKNKEQDSSVLFEAILDDSLSCLVKSHMNSIRQILIECASHLINYAYEGKVTLSFQKEFYQGEPFICYKLFHEGVNINPHKNNVEEYSMVRLQENIGFLGGTLEVELSEERVEYCFRLPFKEFKSSTEVSPEFKEKTPDEIKILIVEDDTINQNLLERVFMKYGLIYDIANNGLEALSYVRSSLDEPYDLIFMDMQMPHMDGLTASRLIREHIEYDESLIIAYTGNSLSTHKDECFAAGMDDFLLKPVEIRKLKSLLTNFSRGDKKLKIS